MKKIVTNISEEGYDKIIFKNMKDKPSYPYTGKEKERPCPCGARGEACMTCPWD